MPQHLNDAECAEFARLLRQAIEADRFPLSPRVQRWKELLIRLDPTQRRPAAIEPYPLAKARVNSTIGQRKRRR